jgi:hypothetical protein
MLNNAGDRQLVRYQHPFEICKSRALLTAQRSWDGIVTAKKKFERETIVSDYCKIERILERIGKASMK